MNNLFNELIITLDDLVDRCQALLDILKLEKQAILRASVDDLNAIRAKKEDLIQAIQVIDSRRFDLLSGLAMNFNVDQNSLTVSILAELAGNPFSGPLFRLSDRLSTLLKNIQDVNKANQSLLDHSISFVRSAVSFLSHLLTPSPVYYRTGKMSSGDTSGRLLSGAA